MRERLTKRTKKLLDALYEHCSYLDPRVEAEVIILGNLLEEAEPMLGHSCSPGPTPLETIFKKELEEFE